MVSPQSRSIQHLRKQGFTVEVLERWIRFPSRKPPCRACGNAEMVSLRRDIVGCDLLAFSPMGILLVQVTSGANAASRMVKLLNDPEVAPKLLRWLKAGGAAAVHSWTLAGPRGERKTWTLRVQEITPQMISVPNQAKVAVEDYGEES